MAKRRVEYILYDESFKNKKCDKRIIKLGINREKCRHFASMNSRIIIFLASLEKKKSRVHLDEIKRRIIPS